MVMTKRKPGRPRKARSEPLPVPPLPTPPWHRPKVQRVNPPGANITDTDDYWRKHLPKPPANSQSDEEVGLWLDAVNHAGGAAALHWLKAAENWPRSLGPPMRHRMLHYVIQLYERANNAAHRENMRRIEDQVQQQEAERRRVQREQGW